MCKMCRLGAQNEAFDVFAFSNFPIGWKFSPFLRVCPSKNVPSFVFQTPKCDTFSPYAIFHSRTLRHGPPCCSRLRFARKTSF